MSNFEYLSLNKTDEKKIREFYASVSKSGSIQFSLCREPGFFDALVVEGNEPDVFVMRKKDDGEIITSVITSKKSCFINSAKTTVCYISSLRLSEQYRNRLLGFFAKAFYTHQHEKGRLISLMTIFEDNKIARKNILTGKGHLPLMKDFGQIRTRIFKPIPVKNIKNDYSKVDIRTAEIADMNLIIDFLHENGSSKTFFPVYEAEHFNSGNGLLKNLKIEDIALAFNGKVLVGVTALWDQTSFRYWKIHSYSKIMKLLRPLINLYSWLKRKPLLPASGIPIKYLNLAIVCIKNNSQSVFNHLLNYQFRKIAGSKNTYIAYAMHESNPFYDSFKVPGIDLRSRLYIAYWKQNESLVSLIKTGEIYIETGAI
jgi:hypothetical protein